jgi:hypothetical protein
MADINVNYGVGGMSQPTPVTCWATSFAVVINYRDGSAISPIDVCATVGQDPNVAETWSTVTQAAEAYGLRQSASACMNIQGWADLLANNGPILRHRPVGRARSTRPGWPERPCSRPSALRNRVTAWSSGTDSTRH